MNRYDLIIFDLDGTILDTTEGVISSVKYVINEMGYEMLSDEKLCTFIGPPIQYSFSKYYGVDGIILDEMSKLFRNNYKDVNLLKAVPYEGIYKLFDSLNNMGVVIAIATYKREDYALDLLKHFKINEYAGIIYGSDYHNKLKKNDIIEKCIYDSKISDKNRILMVGDTIHDLYGAESVGIDFIGVDYGFGFKKKEDRVIGSKVIGYVRKPIEILKYI